MNTDQATSILRTLMKFASGAIITWSATKSQGVKDVASFAANYINGPDFIAMTLMFVGTIWSHIAHASPGASQKPSSGPGVVSTFFLFSVLSGSLVFSGCSTPQSTAYKSAGTVVVSVDTAMHLWGAYVAANHPSAAVEQEVESAYEKYQASMLVVCDLGAAYAATSVTNATATQQAQLALSQAITNADQELSDLETLLSQLGVKL